MHISYEIVSNAHVRQLTVSLKLVLSFNDVITMIVPYSLGPVLDAA